MDLILKASSSSSSQQKKYFLFIIFHFRGGSVLKAWMGEIRDREETEVLSLSDIISIRPQPCVGSVMAEIKTKTASILNICDSLQRCAMFLGGYFNLNIETHNLSAGWTRLTTAHYCYSQHWRGASDTKSRYLFISIVGSLRTSDCRVISSETAALRLSSSSTTTALKISVIR